MPRNADANGCNTQARYHPRFQRKMTRLQAEKAKILLLIIIRLEPITHWIHPIQPKTLTTQTPSTPARRNDPTGLGRPAPDTESKTHMAALGNRPDLQGRFMAGLSLPRKAPSTRTIGTAASLGRERDEKPRRGSTWPRALSTRVSTSTSNVTTRLSKCPGWACRRRFGTGRMDGPWDETFENWFSSRRRLIRGLSDVGSSSAPSGEGRQRESKQRRRCSSGSTCHITASW